MPAETATDRLTFLGADDFGAEAIYTPVGGAAVPGIAGIFDRPHVSRDFGGVGGPISTAAPTFICRSADLPAAAVGGDAGDTLTVDAVVYRVADLAPDGTGFTVIMLAA